MKVFYIALGLLSLNLCAQHSPDKEITTKVDAVTVYIDGAQIIRSKKIHLEKGTHLLNFSQLSPFIDSKSVKVKALGSITVLSVIHQRNYNDTIIANKKTLEFREQIKKLNKLIILERTNLSIISEEIDFLRMNREISGTETELSLENYSGIADFYHQKLRELKFSELKHTEELTRLKQEKNVISKQLFDLRGEKIYPTGEVHIKVEVPLATTAEFSISYKVSNAGWFPSYDIRHTGLDAPLELTYKANVRQDTKVDWKDVKIKFSSNQPVESLIAPRLKTYYLNYYSQPPSYSSRINQVSGTVYSASDNLPLPGASILVKGTTIGTIADLDGRYSLTMPNNSNDISCSYIGFLTEDVFVSNEITNFRLTEDISALEEVVVIGYGTQKKSNLTGAVSNVNFALSGKTPGVAIRGTSSIKPSKSKHTSIPLEVFQKKQSTNFEFEINSPYSIESNNKSYTINMKKHQLNTDYKYICTPKISSNAYLIAQVPDFEKLNLLEGEANLFFEDTYIGKTVLDISQITDTLNISLGKDKNIVINREIQKDYQVKKVIGSKKTETKAWNITIKNNKNSNIKINIYDQIPVSMLNDIDVKPELITDNGLLNEQTGEVKWNLEVDTYSHKSVNLIYKVTYSKHHNLLLD